MIRVFKRRRPQPEPAQTSTSDRLVAAYNGYTPEQWEALPELARKEAREHVAWRLREPA